MKPSTTFKDEALVRWALEYNACTEPCDMYAGPCACGAWHRSELGKWLPLYPALVRAGLTEDLEC